MAIIRPFKSYRPTAKLVEKVAAVPYDVLNSKEAKEVVKGNKYSFLHVDKAEVDLEEDVDLHSVEVYEKAASNLNEMIADGTYIQEEKPALYLYELTMNGRSQTGLVVCTSIDDYMNDVIKKHEFTRADKEQDRINHVDYTNANTGPIFLTYRAEKRASEIIANHKTNNAAVYDWVADDGIGHKVWVVDDQGTVDELVSIFGEIPYLYIADGHHRAASAVKVGRKRRAQNPGFTGQEEYNYFLAVLFPDDEMYIMDYNRVVADLNGNTSEEFIKKISEKFDVEKMSAPETNHYPKEKKEYSMYLDDEWYTVRIKKEYVPDDVVDSLDVALLQDNLLRPILDIDDPRTNDRIDFVGGIRGLEELEKRCHADMKVAFAVYPTSMDELFNVADGSRVMPPKSTWFEPKLRSGIFVHKLS